MAKMSLEDAFRQAENAYIATAVEDHGKRMMFKEAYSIMQAMIIMKFSDIPDWENMPIQAKVYPGHLKGALYVADSITTTRWNYWLDLRATQEVQDKPIPQIDFLTPEDEGYRLTLQMLKHCLDVPGYRSNPQTLYNFVDWILYGYGSSLVEDIDHIPIIQSAYWYENFRPQLMLMHPGDYFAEVANDVYGNSMNVHQFFPTPVHVSELMAKLTFAGMDSEEAKYSGVNDPCAGTGRLLLHSSNYSLLLHGSDIDQFMVKLSTLNGYHYIPWMVEMDDDIQLLLENKGVKPEVEEADEEEADGFADFITSLFEKLEAVNEKETEEVAVE